MPEQVRMLEEHYRILERWNKAINLTAVRKPEEAVERHYCESLFLGAQLPPGDLSIADIGSGAGFPGIPVAVLRGDCQVTLVESDGRKAAFLREATRGYKNVRVLRERAEAVADRFDWTISRAVNLKELGGEVVRLAPHLGVLGGEAAPELEGIAWQPGIRLPWGQRRMLWLGERRACFT